MLALLLIRVLRLLNSSVQISFEFKHDAATKLVQGQGKARDVTGEKACGGLGDSSDGSRKGGARTALRRSSMATWQQRDAGRR